jgi:phage-related protein
MATFPNYEPAYALAKRSEPKMRTTRFGDGYEQRVTFGIPGHMNPKEYALTFYVNDTGAATIESFLDARAADANSFDWQPPDANSTSKFVCFAWNREFVGPNFNSITATFRQVFEP